MAEQLAVMWNGLCGDLWNTPPTQVSSNLHFIQVTPPDNDVVNEVPVFGPGINPRSLVHVTELEESVCDGKTLFRAVREQLDTVSIHVANTMMTNDTLPYVVISACLALKSPNNMILSFCEILQRVEYNVS